MVMENKIKHVGVVESVVGECVKVRVVQSSACASCKVAKQCNTSESKEKIIDIYTKDNRYSAGDRVNVMASYNVGFLALSLGMLVPMLLMLLVLFAMLATGYSELISALGALLSLAPYYFLLFMFRGRINRKVTLDIELSK